VAAYWGLRVSNRRVLNTAYASLGVYVEYLLGLVASILIARALQPADMGVYGLLVWICATGVVVANAGITLAAIKFVAELRGAGHETLVGVLMQRLRRLQRVTLCGVLAALVIILLLSHQRLVPGVAWMPLALMLLSLALRAPYMLNVALLKGREDFRSTAIIAGLGAIANLAMVLALIWADAATLRNFLAVYALSSLLFWGLSQWRATPSGQAATSATLPADMEARLRHHLRIVAFTSIVGTIGSGELELLPITLFATAADAGLFKVASALASGAALLVPGVLSAQLLPMMAHARGHGQGEAEFRFVATTTWLVMLGAPLVAFGFVHASTLIPWLYGSAYAPAGAVFAALLVARTASVIGQGATAYLLSADRQKGLMQLTVLFTLLRLVFIFMAAWAYGLWGAVTATVVLALLGSASTIAMALRVAKARLPMLRLLRILAAAAVPALACLSVRALPPFWMLCAGATIFAIGYPLALWVLRGLEPGEVDVVRGWLRRLRRTV